MIRDDLVKQLEKAEQIAAATRGQHISISFPAIEAVFRANEALHIWDMALESVLETLVDYCNNTGIGTACEVIAAEDALKRLYKARLKESEE
jgi:uncharacterized protein YjaG (DUF416 family)